MCSPVSNMQGGAGLLGHPAGLRRAKGAHGTLGVLPTVPVSRTAHPGEKG